jgi:hypothetical protein
MRRSTATCGENSISITSIIRGIAFENVRAITATDAMRAIAKRREAMRVTALVLSVPQVVYKGGKLAVL